MKKIVLLLGIIAAVASAQAGCTWDWWFNNGHKDIRGCALGLGCSNATVTGAQIGLAATKANEVKKGAQGAIGYSRVDKLRNGVQFALVSQAKSAALQFGLICINDTGFLPVFVLFNFDKTMFGKER